MNEFIENVYQIEGHCQLQQPSHIHGCGEYNYGLYHRQRMLFKSLFQYRTGTGGCAVILHRHDICNTCMYVCLLLTKYRTSTHQSPSFTLVAVLAPAIGVCSFPHSCCIPYTMQHQRYFQSQWQQATRKTFQEIRSKSSTPTIG